MSESTGTESSLVKLSDSEFVLEEREHDIRGLEAFDKDGEKIGSVKDLYVDEQERKVRFLDVGAGGLLGMGEKHFLIPVEAVRAVYDDGVTVDQSRERIASSPPFNTDVVPQPPYQRDIYDYYGYGRAGGRADPGAWPGGI